MTHARTHTQPGYALIELMLVLALLALFSAFANELFMSCIHVKDDALSGGQTIAQTDAVVRLLRGDVWGASAIQSPDNTAIELRMPEGSVVRWRLHTRTVDEETTTWLTRSEVVDGVETSSDPLFAPEGIGFETDGDNLYLITGTDRVRLPRASSLLGGPKP